MDYIEKALEKHSRKEDRQSHSVKDTGFLPGDTSGLISPNGIDPGVVTILQPDSLAAEQYKNLRTHILRSKMTKGYRTFLITSALPGEGKTITLVNLAVSIALGMDETVLLVDTDLRNPGIHRFMGLKTTQGLSDYLTCPGIELRELLLKTSIDKLTILPAGPIPPNPVELINSRKMTELITEVKERYDDRIILFDSPPLTTLADARIIGFRVDAIILVVESRKTPREVVSKAISALADANIIGVVFNRADEPSPEYYYYDYRYSYGQRMGQKDNALNDPNKAQDYSPKGWLKHVYRVLRPERKTL
jgi:exopolysaccharide/PEP-CTERM locus tyrosine autokinase